MVEETEVGPSETAVALKSPVQLESFLGKAFSGGKQETGGFWPIHSIESELGSFLYIRLYPDSRVT